MRKIIIILIVLAVASASIAYYAFFGTTKVSPTIEKIEQVSVEGVGTPEDREPFSGVGTLASLQAQGRDLECQIKYSNSQYEEDVEGTYFVSGGKIRGDFMIPAKEFGGNIISSMIMNDTTVYVWSKIGEDTFGFKTAKAAERVENVDTKEPVPLEADIKYTCTQWATVDGSIFVPPASVNFTDAQAVIKGGMEYPVMGSD